MYTPKRWRNSICHLFSSPIRVFNNYNLKQNYWCILEILHRKNSDVGAVPPPSVFRQEMETQFFKKNAPFLFLTKIDILREKEREREIEKRFWVVCRKHFKDKRATQPDLTLRRRCMTRTKSRHRLQQQLKHRQTLQDNFVDHKKSVMAKRFDAQRHSQVESFTVAAMATSKPNLLQLADIVLNFKAMFNTRNGDTSPFCCCCFFQKSFMSPHFLNPSNHLCQLNRSSLVSRCEGKV